MKMMMILMMMMFINNKLMFASLSAVSFSFMIKLNLLNLSWVSYTMTYDTVSFWIISLTVWIMMLISLIKTNNKSTQDKMDAAMLLILFMVFSAWNFLSFYIMFEMSMVMIVLSVMAWGYQPERVEAVMFMIFITILFSLPFFLTLMKKFNQLNFWFISINMLMWDCISFMFIFMVKLPVYFIHVWLPKIHVEAPVQGSMVLASIMLKLGCYGLIRMAPMSLKINTQWQAAIIAFALWSTLVLSMISAIQADLKSLIAYSSIVHMTSVFVSIILMKQKSITASIMVMLGHGLCSSALFFLCNTLYKYSKSRSTMMNKGILMHSPTAAFLWFCLCMSNAPMPPSINMMGEVLMFKTMLVWSSKTIGLLVMTMFASSYFSIVLFYMPAHGSFSNNIKIPLASTSKNLAISWFHTIPLISLIIKAAMVEV